MASSHQPKDFDVFLSFRGEDTRRGFVSHLYEALDQHGIRTFIDDNLTRGENVPEELLEVIENSSASIIVFSENYASSSWCLDELGKIIDCTKKVLPVFYQVDPSEVRKQKGDFGKALTRLEKKVKDKTKVQRWREALTNAANIAGWDWDDRNSCTGSELVQKIVEEISNSEFIQMPSNVATMQLVGINSRIEAVTKYLDIESNDVRMVGITGLGGIGKTTIAKAIYNSFSNHFKAKSFLENVREWSNTYQGIIHLQETLLKGISEDKNLRVNTIYEGTTMINKILRLKKVLIILDDVDNANQIETLLGQCECFAFRSRIILTTRNKSLLVDQNGLSTYDYGVKELDEDEAIELFRKHAFPSNEVPEDYLELEKQAISYAKGLPLALKVMGRDLCGKAIREWDDALDCYKTNPLEDIQNILKRSYERLTENEKTIFLGIACIFKGYDMSYNMIKDVLEPYGLNPEYGIQNLIDKCLLTIDEDNYYLSMHDLLQQMGMDIVRQEAQQKLGERSRLWYNEEALDVLTENMGSDKIQSIKLWSPKLEPEEEAQFCKMKDLRLRCCNGPLECLPNGLRHVEVARYPSRDLQSFFQLLPEIIGLPPNLPPCLGVTRHMIMFPHSSTMLPICHNCPCEYSFEVTGDENDIPNWFNHQRDENLISFSIGPEFPTIALCIAFGMQDSRCNFDYHVIISINGSERMFGRNSIEKDRNFGHLSFSCRRQSSLQELFRNLQLTDRNHVEIHCETFHIFQEIAPIVKRIGVHVECNCPRQNPSIFQDINRHLSLQSGQVLSCPVIKKSKEISETEEGGECEDETDADIETTLKAEGITPEQDESNEEDPSPSLLSVEKCLLTLTQGAGESSSSTSQDSVECSLPMSQTPNSRNEADVLTNTWSNQDGVQDLSFESIKVSEISELMDFPSRVLSLKIEEFDDLEFIPQGEVLSSPVIKKSKEISETEERGECEDETDADIEATLKAKVITPEQDESNEEDPSPSLFLEEKSSLPPTQGARESSLLMSQTPNSRNEADVLTDTWSNQDGVQDLSFESIKVSEISELMDLPTRVHSLKIEGCDDLEFIPKRVMSSELSLQDLYIINCCSLKSFPKDHPPTALKILYIRNCKKLNFPLTTEKKTHQDALLEYLCIGSSCDSLKSISLDLFPNLKSLSIWDCANLESLSMPVQKNLTSLEALEIRDCPKLVSFLGGGLCTMNLMSIWLSNCKKLEKLPELHTLGSLQSMFINNCPELESLSEKGLPSRLSLLSITFCNKLKLKDEWGLDGLAYLRRLEIEGGCVDVGSFPEKFLPSNLSSLRISGLLNVKNLDNKGFQQLTALQRLEISCCPNLQSLPEDGFPSSLSSLCIKECPLLTSKFRNKKGKDWSKIDHISCIEIDEEVIS